MVEVGRVEGEGNRLKVIVLPNSRRERSLTFLLQADTCDVAFYFKSKKVIIAKVTYSDLADVFRGGSGLTVSICSYLSSPITLMILLGILVMRRGRSNAQM